MLLFHAAHLHAQVARFDDDAHAFRADLVGDGVRDLAGHALLNLQAPREHVHQPRNFAEPEHLFARQIGDVRLAEKWQQVMLAQAEEFDVFHDDHFVVVHAERGAIQHRFQILVDSRWSGTSAPSR